MLLSAFSLIFLAQTTQEISVDGWDVHCESDAAVEDGLSDRCIMETRRDGLSISIVRTFEGADFSVRIRGCNPSQPVEPSNRTHEQLSGEGATGMFQGGVIENVIMNARGCDRPPRIVVIDVKEAEQLLAATSALRES